VKTVLAALALGLAIGNASASEGAVRIGLPDFSYVVTVSPYVNRAAACVARDGDAAQPWRMAGLGTLRGLDWSPDGGRFVVAFTKAFTSAVMISPADPSGGLRALTAPRRKTESDSGPRWSPDGSRVAFVRDVSYGPHVDYRRAGLWAVDVATRHTTHFTRALPYAFDWSPSGDRLAVRTTGDLMLFSASGTRLWTISGNANGLQDVAWSPAGDLIAARFGREILILMPDRTPVATIELQPSTLESLETGLSWSPNGRLLAVGGGVIYDRDGQPAGRYAPPSTSAAVAADPRWTPDGTAIVFRQAPARVVNARYSQYLVLGTADLYVWEATDSAPVALTSTPQLDESDVVFRPGHAGGTAGKASSCFEQGTPGNDVIYGDGDEDLFLMGAGNDVVYARGGNDLVFGGAGNDRLLPGRGRDLVFGNRGNDRILARDRQRDGIAGGPGFDRAWVDRRDAVSGVERVYRR